MFVHFHQKINRISQNQIDRYQLIHQISISKHELFAKFIISQEKIKILKFLTLLKVIAPTIAGATKPGIDANVFVIPTNIPI